MEKIKEIKQICKTEAEKNPVDKDLFQAGKQFAYSHIYFELLRIPQREDKYLLLLGILSAICGIELATILAMNFLW